MADHRLYGFWGNLEEALITGKPQNEQKNASSADQFKQIYSSQKSMKEFLAAMAGIQMGAFMLFAEKFDFSKYNTFCDSGGALGALCVQVAKKQSHIKCISYDLPEVAAVAKEYIKILYKYFEKETDHYITDVIMKDIIPEELDKMNRIVKLSQMIN